MKKFIYGDKERCEASFPAGGIGTGFTQLLPSGELGRLKVHNRQSDFSSAKPFFAVKAEKNGTLISAKAIAAENFTHSDSHNASRFFASGEFSCFFPFSQLCFKDEGFPGDVKMTVFNPFIPLNVTDSGIPAAFFEFEILNTSSDAADFTLCGVLDNGFCNYRTTAGCTSNGAAYLVMDGGCDDEENSEGNMCIATDSKNISFCEYLIDDVSHDAFMDIFSSVPTFNGQSKLHGTTGGNYGALAAHFSLMPGECKLIRFLVSWYFPYLGTEYRLNDSQSIYKARNYYAQYFESSVECTYYCFKHWDRLKEESLLFTSTLLSSTLPDEMLRSVADGLYELKKASCLCIDGGLFYAEPLSDWLNSLPLLHLFPSLFHSMLENRLVYAMDENGKIGSELIIPRSRKDDFSTNYQVQDGDTSLSLAIITSVLKDFKQSGSEDELIENWYYLSKAADLCRDELCELLKNGLDSVDDKALFLYFEAMRSAKEIAHIVKDKKRAEAYDAIFSALSNAADENMLICRLMSKESYEGAVFLLNNGRIDEAKAAISALSFKKPDMASYALLNAMSGFEYDAYKKHIGFSPLSDHCPLDFGDTFRCFFSTAGGYGYVEEGIDYIEVNMVKGKLDIKSFSVPRTPRLVQYGGRNWRFTDTGLCAGLDTDLVVTPDKKLTILIDIKPQK